MFSESKHLVTKKQNKTKTVNFNLEGYDYATLMMATINLF